jgi:hypothetical protein
MMVELRTHTFVPGQLPVFLQRYAAQGLPRQLAHGGRLAGCWTSDTGTLNQLLQLWEFDDAAQRSRQRAGLQQDAQWQAFETWMLPLLQERETRLLKTTAFAPRPPHPTTGDTHAQPT